MTKAGPEVCRFVCKEHEKGKIMNSNHDSVSYKHYTEHEAETIYCRCEDTRKDDGLRGYIDAVT
jgi:hypothetical protein